MPNHFILIFFATKGANYFCPRRDFARKSKSRGGTLVACVYFKESIYLQLKYTVSMPEKNLDLLEQGPHGIFG